VRGQVGVHCFVFCKLVSSLRFWFSCSLRLAGNGLWLFSFNLAAMVSLKVWISVRRVFVSRVRFVCVCPGGCVEVAGGGWRESVCGGWKLGDERTLEADSCNTDPTSLLAMSARA